MLDPDAAAVYRAFQEAGRPAYETLTADKARVYYAQARFATNPEPPELARVTPLSIPAPHGVIPTRLYVPKEPRRHDGLSPALVFFHGGGWVIGDLDSHDVVCRQLAVEGALIVISVDYRLAPEHKFPAAIEDAIAATQWIAANARELGIDASRLSIGGDSAGGNLTAVVALAAREAGGPALAGQVLIYPATDFAMTHGSHSEPETSVLLTHSVICWFRDHYLNGAADIHDWRASPARAQNLAGLAARLCADRRRRSAARRRRRLCRAPQTGRRIGHDQALSRPIPWLLHDGQVVAAGQCRRRRDRRMVEGIGMTVA
ncbi:acetyl esterase [Bradyrhizobium sp. SBR1B]|nr:acetyl esterase [Bradyrhizobium sp. SBR1B]